MNVLQFLKNGSGIHIKEENKGKFTDYCGGKVTSECISRGKHSPNPAIRKRATFAANARKWKHKFGGNIRKMQTAAGGPLTYDEYIVLSPEEQKAYSKAQKERNLNIAKSYIGTPTIPNLYRAARVYFAPTVPENPYIQTGVAPSPGLEKNPKQIISSVNKAKKLLTEAERMGIPKGIRNNIIKSPLRYDKEGNLYAHKDYFYRKGWGIIDDAKKSGVIRVPEGDYKLEVFKKYPFLNDDNPFSTMKMNHKFPYFSEGRLWPDKYGTAEDIIVIPSKGNTWAGGSKFGSLLKDVKPSEVSGRGTPLVNGEINKFPTSKTILYRLNKETNQYEPIIGKSKILTNPDENWQKQILDYDTYVNDMFKSIMLKKKGGRVKKHQAFVNGVSILDSNPDAYKFVKRKMRKAAEGGNTQTWMQKAGNWYNNNSQMINSIGSIVASGISGIMGQKALNAQIEANDEKNNVTEAKLQEKNKAKKLKEIKEKHIQEAIQNSAGLETIINPSPIVDNYEAEREAWLETKAEMDEIRKKAEEDNAKLRQEFANKQSQQMLDSISSGIGSLTDFFSNKYNNNTKSNFSYSYQITNPAGKTTAYASYAPGTTVVPKNIQERFALQKS